jgi:hypothetical protein
MNEYSFIYQRRKSRVNKKMAKQMIVSDYIVVTYGYKSNKKKREDNRGKFGTGMAMNRDSL